MLCQLVCVDRRYQRMNCFNIRELQGILKRKFFTDLVNTSDSHKATESTLINMRHKNNMSNILLYDQSLLYNFDLTNVSKSKNFLFTPGKVYSYAPTSYLPTINTISSINMHQILNLHFINIYKTFLTLLKDFFNFICLPNINSFAAIKNSFLYLGNTVYFTPNLNILSYTSFNNLYTNKTTVNTNDHLSYNTNTISYTPFNSLMSSNFAENSST